MLPSYSEPRRCYLCQCLVVVVVFGVLLSAVASCRRQQRILVVVIVGFSLLSSASCCRLLRLVVVDVSSLLAAASLLVADSVGFTPCRRCGCRHLVFGAGSLIVGDVLLLLSLLDSCRGQRRQRRGVL